VKWFSRLRRNLRGSILSAFSVLLLMSFALIGGVFNLAVRQYIRYGALDELNERVHFFYVHDDFTLAAYSAEAEQIAAVLRERLSPLIRNRRVRTEDGVFYATSVSATLYGQPGWHRVYYVDITEISRFSSRVNLLLFLLVGAIWALAMIVTTFLAGSLALPLRSLNRFARQIGSGDFTPNDEKFPNEEFEVLNQSLNYAARQLAKYDNDQKIFFQNVSHELRTPLMAIKSYAEGINHGVMDTKIASNVILDATNRLKSMVDDILYVSRIDNITTTSADKLDLCQVITKRIEMQESPTQKGIIRFAPAQPVVIQGIQSYIERAIDNLISNALRYAETRIDIHCHIQDNHAILQITDDGPGFAPDSLPHVFERFYRGKNGLTGIGLAIVKSIVDQHGGTTMAENQEKGARLTIKFPVKR